MDKNYITNNWEKFYKNYSKHNPDLLLNGISTKRALLNHYIRYGINENRKIFDNDNDNIIINNNENKVITNNIPDTIKENILILNELMIIEKLDN